MALRYSSDTGKPNVGLPVLIGGVAFLIVFVGALAFFALRAPATSVQVSNNSADALLREKAREAQGDFNRLRPGDQQKLISQYGIQGAVSKIKEAYNSPSK